MIHCNYLINYSIFYYHQELRVNWKSHKRSSWSLPATPSGLSRLSLPMESKWYVHCIKEMKIQLSLLLSLLFSIVLNIVLLILIIIIIYYQAPPQQFATKNAVIDIPFKNSEWVKVNYGQVRTLFSYLINHPLFLFLVSFIY